MKKIFALLVFVFGLSFSASAQEVNFKKIAKDETYEVRNLLNLNDIKTKEIYHVLVYKNEKELDASVNKNELSNEVVNKFRELLTKEQFLKLQENSALFNKVTN